MLKHARLPHLVDILFAGQTRQEIKFIAMIFFYQIDTNFCTGLVLFHVQKFFATTCHKLDESKAQFSSNKNDNGKICHTMGSPG